MPHNLTHVMLEANALAGIAYLVGSMFRIPADVVQPPTPAPEESPTDAPHTL